MKRHLFYTFLVIFGATAIVTLLGLTGVIAIKEGYLTPLVAAFLIEIGGAVIAIFKGANFFEDDGKAMSAENEIRESIRKLDRAFGHNHDRINSVIINTNAELLSAKYLGKTPLTDLMVATQLVEMYLDKVDDDSLNHLLHTIAEILETDIQIGSGEIARFHNLAEKLPVKYAGNKQRLVKSLERFA